MSDFLPYGRQSVNDDDIAAVDQADTLVLADDAHTVAFDYVLEPGADAQWAREWISPVSAPLAIRVRLTGATQVDTLLLLVKERG